MPSNQHEYRSAHSYSIRRVTDKPGTIAVMDGRAVVYNTLSVEMWGFREKFSPGTFTECLNRAGCDLRALVDHESSKLLGRQSAGTLRVADGPDALACDIDIPDVSYGRDAVVLVERRDMTGMSFMFDEQEDAWEFKEDGSVIRTVNKADIYEVTVTGFPAYPATSLDLRGQYRATIERFEEIKRNHQPATPERNWLDDRIRVLWRWHERPSAQPKPARATRP